MKLFRKFVTSILLLAFVITLFRPAMVQAKAYTIPEEMQWWADDKFGMFIHFGSYSQYAQGEWAMSEQKISKKKYQETISAKFNPVNFNAEEIVSYAKNAGMKYIVITAKHHEGLSMWDTKVESFKDYTGTKMYSLQQYTPFGATGRDVLMELKNACEAAGIKFGLYYSIIDWNHSSQEMDGSFTKIQSMKVRKAYINDMKAQLKELVDIYKPAVMWFDGDWTYNQDKPTLNSWWTKADGEDLYNYIKELDSSILVNERVFRGAGLGDFECPEQTVPDTALSRPWETCQTMNKSWGYKESDEKNYRSTKEIVRELVTVASRKGNYLLNIGPKGDGSMTDNSKKVLSGMAKWMNVYSESIYNTTGSPFKKEPAWGLYTWQDKKVYAHVWKRPKNGKLVMSQYKNKKISRVYMLQEADKDIKYSLKNKKITVKLPKTLPNKTDTVVVVEYK